MSWTIVSRVARALVRIRKDRSGVAVLDRIGGLSCIGPRVRLGFPTMDSQQLVDTASQNSQDIVLPKPASSTPRHSIDAILGLANNKRGHQEMEDNARDTQENTGNVRFPCLLMYLSRISNSHSHGFLFTNTLRDFC